MPSQAYTTHLEYLLADAEELLDAHFELQRLPPTHQVGLTAINRAVVVACISAWEAYIEELLREAINAIRPASAPMGAWPALNATARAAIGRFNTPNTHQVRMFISDTIGLPDVQNFWIWPSFNSAQSQKALEDAIHSRHEIAHGVNPRPLIHFPYANNLPDFFRQLGFCTDHAVRGYLVQSLGIANPWPP